MPQLHGRPGLNERRARVGGTAPRNYPTKAKIRQMIEAARDCGLDVFGFEASRDGTIRVMEARAAPAIANDFDRWEARL